MKFDTLTGDAVAQYAYRMEAASQGRGISALVAINEREFFVPERNNRGIGVGAEATPRPTSATTSRQSPVTAATTATRMTTTTTTEA